MITYKLKSMELRLAASQLRSQQALEERKQKREAEKRARSMIPLRLLDASTGTKQPARIISSAGNQRPQAAGVPSKHTKSRVATTIAAAATAGIKGRTVTATGRNTKAPNAETTVMKILPRFYCNFFPRGQSY